MKAADLVTAAADHRAEQKETDLRVLREHFAVCDLDENGWLSLREAEVTLSLQRDEFRRADANQDGGLELSEFVAQQALLLARLGARPPASSAETGETSTDPALAPGTEEDGVGDASAAPASDPAPAAPATGFASLFLRPSDLLRRYDVDESKGINVAELERLFSEMGVPLSAEMVVAQMNPDGVGELGPKELLPLAWIASRYLPEALRPDAPATTETGRAADDAPSSSSSKAPPAVATSHFERLDKGGDGFLDESDLRALQGHARLDVRIRAVLSAMDQDGDGRLSETEFRASMRYGAE
jgi:Ca2+-binding EF-hand superfamily protein